jgi:hypothetical protein
VSLPCPLFDSCDFLTCLFPSSKQYCQCVVASSKFPRAPSFQTLMFSCRLQRSFMQAVHRSLWPQNESRNFVCFWELTCKVFFWFPGTPFCVWWRRTERYPNPGSCKSSRKTLRAGMPAHGYKKFGAGSKSMSMLRQPVMKLTALRERTWRHLDQQRPRLRRGM